MSSLFKVGGTQGKGTVEISDATGVPAIKINGAAVLTEQQTAIAGPAGGTTVDAEARTAIAAIISAMQAHGLIA